MEPLVNAVDRAAYRRRLFSRSLFPHRGVPVLNYGGAIASPDQAFAIGGHVKLLDLASVFSERTNDFNILYLVSSALPPFAADLARWARKNGARVVVNQNGVAYPAWAGKSYRRQNRDLKAVFEQADYVVYQSAFCKLGADRFLIPPMTQWEIVHNPVNTQVFRPRPRRRNRVWRLLAAGTSHARYRVGSALAALAALKRRGRIVHLTIAGDMTWPDAENDFVEDLERYRVSNSVSRRIRYSRAEATELFQSADILLHTKYNDPCPTVPIEAMACGLPVVASGSGGVPELVTGKAGELVDLPLNWQKNLEPDPEALADAVEKVMEDYESYSEVARATAVSRFELSGWIAKHEEIFCSVLEAPSKAAL